MLFLSLCLLIVLHSTHTFIEATSRLLEGLDLTNVQAFFEKFDSASYIKFYIDNVIIVDDEIVKSDFDIEVYSNSFTNISVGDYVTISANLDNISYRTDFGFNKLVNGIGYSTYVDSKDIVFTDGTISLKTIIQSDVFDILNSKMSEDNAEICFGSNKETKPSLTGSPFSSKETFSVKSNLLKLLIAFMQ